MRCPGVFLPHVAMVAGCDLLIVTGTMGVLLVAMRDISCRVKFLLSIGSMLTVVVTFSVIVFFYAVLLSPLAITIV